MGKSYTNYKQARQRFMGPAFQRAAQNFPKLSGKTKKWKKKKRGVLNGVLQPIIVKIDTAQFEEAFRKLAKSVTKSGKTMKILAGAVASSMLKGVSVGIQFDGQMQAVEAFLQFEQRWIILVQLGWIRDPEGGLVSPGTLDIVDPSILDDPEEFTRFLDSYLATGQVAEWVPCWHAVATEKIALPLDSVRKQLEERISTATEGPSGPYRIGD